jgi:hypothetical protein
MSRMKTGRIVLLATLASVSTATSAWAAPSPCEARRGIAAKADANPADANPANGSAIGLLASLDRANAVYAIGERLTLNITVKRMAFIEVWELDQSGKLTRIAPLDAKPLTAHPGRPLTLPTAGQSFVIEGPPGKSELHIIARTGPRERITRDLRKNGSGLAYRSIRQDARLCYRIVAPS